MVRKTTPHRDITVYLGGPVSNSKTSGVAEREWLYNELTMFGYKVLSPLRSKYLRKVGEFHVIIDSPLTQPRTLVLRDLRDIQASDVVIFNYVHTPEPSIGSLIEMGYATGLGKFIITIVGKGNERIYNHPFIQTLSSAIVEAEEDAIKVVNGLLADYLTPYATES